MYTSAPIKEVSLCSCISETITFGRLDKTHTLQLYTCFLRFCIFTQLAGIATNGAGLVKLAETYTNAINSGAIPTIYSAWQSVGFFNAVFGFLRLSEHLGCEVPQLASFHASFAKASQNNSHVWKTDGHAPVAGCSRPGRRRLRSCI